MLLSGLSACGSDHKQVIHYDTKPSAPLNGTLTLNVADSAMQGDQPQLALDVTQAILEKDPDNAQAWQRQGDAYFALGQVAQAETAYKKALTVQSSVVNRVGLNGLPFMSHGPVESSRAVIEAVKMGLGRIELASNPAAAEARFADVVAGDPGNTLALSNLGIARDLLGHHAEAQDAYRRVLRGSPDDLAAKVNLGLSLALSGDNAAAIDLLRPLGTRADATPRMRQDYAVAVAMGGDTAEAERVLQADMTPDQASAAVRGYRALRTSAADK